MNKKWMLLVGTVLGALIIAGIAIQNMPFVIVSTFAILSLIALSVFVATISIFVLAGKQKSLLSKLQSENRGTSDNKDLIKRADHIRAWTFLIVFATIVSGLLIYQQNKSCVTNAYNLEKRIAQQSELIESNRKSGLVCLMSNVLDKVDDELKSNPKRILSDETIARITALSYFFLPNSYNYVESDSLTQNELSRERGQLLLTLTQLNLDSDSFEKIKLKTPFSRADLSGADLKGADLSGVDLMGASLKGADLSGANLKGADLRGANLWGSNLGGADLSGATMKRADLRWAEMDEAALKGANLNGSVLTGAKLRNADLTGASVRYADLGGVLFNGANLTGVDMIGSDLQQANLSGTDLTKADLRASNVSEAILKEAILSEVVLGKTGVYEENWLAKLSTWRVIGAKEIQKNHELVEDLTGKTRYSIIKIEQ